MSPRRPGPQNTRRQSPHSPAFVRYVRIESHSTHCCTIHLFVPIIAAHRFNALVEAEILSDRHVEQEANGTPLTEAQVLEERGKYNTLTLACHSFHSIIIAKLVETWQKLVGT